MCHSNPSEISVGGSTTSSPAVTPRLRGRARAAEQRCSPQAHDQSVTRAHVSSPLRQPAPRAARIRPGTVPTKQRSRDEARHHRRIGSARAARRGARARECRAGGPDPDDAHACRARDVRCARRCRSPRRLRGAAHAARGLRGRRAAAARQRYGSRPTHDTASEPRSTLRRPPAFATSCTRPV